MMNGSCMMKSETALCLKMAMHQTCFGGVVQCLGIMIGGL